MSKVALAFAAHPDDAEICFGGTLISLARHGWQVHVLVASVPDFRERRLAEISRGAALLGADVQVLDRPDCWQVEDVPMYRLVGEFDERVRALRPDRVFTHWTGDTHNDHVLTARATMSAVRGHFTDLYQCEQANQYAPSAAPFTVNTYVDISAVMADKLAAVAVHTSQAASEKYTEHLRARARQHGERADCEYAEAFSCVTQRMTP